MCQLPDYFRMSETTDNQGRSHVALEFGFNNSLSDRQAHCDRVRGGSNSRPAVQPAIDPLAALFDPAMIAKVLGHLVEGR